MFSPLVLDIRTPAEYAAGHLEGAVLVHTPEVPSTGLDFARMRLRLNHATRGVPKTGFLDVTDLGGWENWT